jgi:uncharacterized membrane protein YgdD (TMEM256/DUF423 family)
MNHRVPILAAGLLGASGVAAGAFGAHALKPFLVQAGTLETWQTAVHYHLVHAVALLGLGAWMRAEEASPAKGAGAAWCWIVGVVLFSGSLYLLAMGAPHWIGPVTPLGGLALILGWLGLAAAAWPRAGRG